MYDPTSVKALERKRRGFSEKLIVKSLKTKKPHDWRKFLRNEENKQQLVEVMYTCWLQYLKDDRRVILIKESAAFTIRPSA